VIIKDSSHIAKRAQAAVLAKSAGVDADSAAARVSAGRAEWAALASAAASTSTSAEDDWSRRPRTSEWIALCQTKILADLQSDEYVRPGYDLCAYLAQRSALAYLPEDQLTSAIRADTGVTPARFRRWTDIAYCYTLGDTAVIVFRGTVVWNPVQWLHSNLFAVPFGLPARHLGFRLAWGRMRAKITTWLTENLPAGGNVLVAGHSLGGAIALLAAYDLAETHQIRAVVTIGAPRVGLGRFRDEYLDRPCGRIGDRRITLGQVTQRLTHEDDLVSRVPPPPIFRHVGDALRLDALGRVLPGESENTFSRILRSIDGAIGWVYRTIDQYRVRAVTSITSPPPPRSVFGRPRRAPAAPASAAAGAFGVEPKTSASERFLNDVLKAQRMYPFLSLVTAQAAYVGLAVASSAVAVTVFVLGCFDLRSHKSGLYVDAFMARYRANERAPGRAYTLTSTEAVRRAFNRRTERPPAVSLIVPAAVALTAGGVWSLFWPETTGWVRFYPLIAGPAVFLLGRTEPGVARSLALSAIAAVPFLVSPLAASVASFLQLSPLTAAAMSSAGWLPLPPHDAVFLVAFMCLTAGGLARAADADAGGIVSRAGAVLFMLSLVVPLGPGRAAAIAAIEPFSLMFGDHGLRGTAMLIQLLLLAIASVFYFRTTIRADADTALGFVVMATAIAVVAGLVPVAGEVSGFVTLAHAVLSVLKAAAGPGVWLYLVVAGLANALLARVER